jgi:hypothetical protein
VDSTILQTYPKLRFEQTYLEVSLFLYGDLIKPIFKPPYACSLPYVIFCDVETVSHVCCSNLTLLTPF